MITKGSPVKQEPRQPLQFHDEGEQQQQQQQQQQLQQRKLQQELQQQQQQQQQQKQQLQRELQQQQQQQQLQGDQLQQQRHQNQQQQHWPVTKKPYKDRSSMYGDSRSPKSHQEKQELQATTDKGARQSPASGVHVENEKATVKLSFDKPRHFGYDGRPQARPVSGNEGRTLHQKDNLTELHYLGRMPVDIDIGVDVWYYYYYT